MDIIIFFGEDIDLIGHRLFIQYFDSLFAFVDSLFEFGYCF